MKYLIIFSIFLVSTNVMAEGVNLKLGSVEVIHDGPVSCKLFHYNGNSGIACNSSQRLDLTKAKHAFLKPSDGDIERFVMDQSLCYTFTYNGKASISCINP